MVSHDAQSGKAELRSIYAAERNLLDALERRRWSGEACSHVAAMAVETQIHTIMVYISFRSELDLSSLIEWCWQKEIEVIAPKCTFVDRGMILYKLDSFDQLRAGAYGIPEPDPSLAKEVPEGFIPELVLVPGLAFDRNGGRMGYGGGYYDRFWQEMSALAAQTGRKPVWLGASFEAQIRDDVPGESHDLRLDGVATEQGIYWRKEREW